MTENVILTMKTQQLHLDENEMEELIAGAAYYYRNGKHYILYDTVDPDNGEQSGNTIKIGDDRVDVIRRGSVKVHMVFEKDKRISTFYRTAFGSIQMDIVTYEIHTTQSGEWLETEIRYDLYMDEKFISECRVVIRVASKEKVDLHIIEGE